MDLFILCLFEYVFQVHAKHVRHLESPAPYRYYAPVPFLPWSNRSGAPDFLKRKLRLTSKTQTKVMNFLRCWRLLRPWWPFFTLQISKKGNEMSNWKCHMFSRALWNLETAMQNQHKTTVTPPALYSCLPFIFFNSYYMLLYQLSL